MSRSLGQVGLTPPNPFHPLASLSDNSRQRSLSHSITETETEDGSIKTTRTETETGSITQTVTISNPVLEVGSQRLTETTTVTVSFTNRFKKICTEIKKVYITRIPIESGTRVETRTKTTSTTRTEEATDEELSQIQARKEENEASSFPDENSGDEPPEMHEKTSPVYEPEDSVASPAKEISSADPNPAISLVGKRIPPPSKITLKRPTSDLRPPMRPAGFCGFVSGSDSGAESRSLASPREELLLSPKEVCPENSFLNSLAQDLPTRSSSLALKPAFQNPEKDPTLLFQIRKKMPARPVSFCPSSSAVPLSHINASGTEGFRSPPPRPQREQPSKLTVDCFEPSQKVDMAHSPPKETTQVRVGLNPNARPRGFRVQNSSASSLEEDCGSPSPERIYRAEQAHSPPLERDRFRRAHWDQGTQPKRLVSLSRPTDSPAQVWTPTSPAETTTQTQAPQIAQTNQTPQTSQTHQLHQTPQIPRIPPTSQAPQTPQTHQTPQSPRSPRSTPQSPPQTLPQTTQKKLQLESLPVQAHAQRTPQRVQSESLSSIQLRSPRNPQQVQSRALSPRGQRIPQQQSQQGPVSQRIPQQLVQPEPGQTRTQRTPQRPLARTNTCPPQLSGQQ
eukprot:TRINITY_DN5494_c0_g1_i3.p1 TRINITY_DN5494_c0_g1~~TRINITY_DN5494_c0_g1_i3.p1  ORF type:complete len:654 (+),score=91.25 TRINITY_DN5494_c0_g1_i3:100-1962(+)